MSKKKSDNNPRKKGGAGKSAPPTGRKKSDSRRQPPTGRTEEKKINKPTKSPPVPKENKIRLDNENDEIYEPVSESDIDVEASEMLDRKRKSAVPKEYIRPPSPAKAPISDSRRKFKRILFYVVTIAVLVSVCLVLSLTVFFKIDEIEVEGKTRYNADDIIAYCQIERGDNLILCQTSAGEKSIQQQFPYIESVTISKKLFNKIIINVKEAVPTSIIESDGKYIVLSKKGKIIEINDKKKYNVPTVLGAKLKDVKLSSTVKYSDENIQNYITEILKAVSENKIENIETIDISSLSNIKLIRKNGFTIIIGAPENIEYKIKTAKNIMSKNVDKDDIGILNVSLANPGGGKSYFKSESAVQESSEQKKTESSKTVKTESSTSEESTEEENQSDENSDSEEPDDTDNDDTDEDYGYDDEVYDDNDDDWDYDDDVYDDYDDYDDDDYDDTYDNDDTYDYDTDDTDDTDDDYDDEE